MMRVAASAAQPRSRETLWRTLQTFNVTRIAIALVLLAYLTINARQGFWLYEGFLYQQTCAAYLALAVGLAMFTFWQRRRLLLQLCAGIAADLVMITILYVAAGGARSGLAILYLFPLAGSAVLAPMVLALFFAALVALAMLLESAYQLLNIPSDSTISQAGLYGAAFFAAVYLLNRLAARLIRQEQLAIEHRMGLQVQQAINQLVIADMGDGVLVTGRDTTLMRWLKHRGDDSFADIATPEDALLDLELVLCYDTCLDRPVPAIADPCAGDTADVAYARICEAVTLQLRRTAQPSPAAPMPSYRLLRVWLGLAPALAADQWLLDAYAATLVLPAPQQAAARASLLRSVLAQAVAAESHLAPAADAEERNLCLPLARLAGARITHAAKGWTAAVPHLDISVRPVLLPSGLLQALLLAEPGPAAVGAGPVLQPGLAGLTGSTVHLVFNQALEASTVTPAAFSVTEFLAGTGWQTFTATASYAAAAAAGPTVSLLLDHAPAATSQLRLTVIGSGPTPLLGANLIPAGAPHPGADGRTLSTDIARV